VVMKHRLRLRIRRASPPATRALRLPFVEGTNGPSRLIPLRRDPYSRALSCPSRVVPKLVIKAVPPAGLAPG
jgi:hypothetical protein